jgi:hypothetical protein
VQNFFSSTPVPTGLFLPDGEDYAFAMDLTEVDVHRLIAESRSGLPRRIMRNKREKREKGMARKEIDCQWAGKYA